MQLIAFIAKKNPQKNLDFETSDQIFFSVKMAPSLNACFASCRPH